MKRRIRIVIDMDSDVYEFLRQWAGEDEGVCDFLKQLLLDGGLEYGLWMDLPFSFSCREEVSE